MDNLSEMSICSSNVLKLNKLDEAVVGTWFKHELS